MSCLCVLGDTRWRSWLRHYATSRKVAASIPDGVIGICNWHNPSDRTKALGSTQPLTEMSTRNIFWGVEAVCTWGSQPYHLHVPTVLKSGSFSLLEPSGPVQACNGIALPLPFTVTSGHRDTKVAVSIEKGQIYHITLWWFYLCTEHLFTNELYSVAHMLNCCYKIMLYNLCQYCWNKVTLPNFQIIHTPSKWHLAHYCFKITVCFPTLLAYILQCHNWLKLALNREAWNDLVEKANTHKGL
jgi:hypothetical protein